MPDYGTGIVSVTITKQDNEIIDGDLVDPNLFTIHFFRIPSVSDIVVHLEQSLLDDLLVELVPHTSSEDYTPLCIIDCNEMECVHRKDGKCSAGIITLTRVDNPVMGILACQQAGHADGKVNRTQEEDT